MENFEKNKYIADRFLLHHFGMEVFASELAECLNDFRMAYYFMPSNQLLAEYLDGEFCR